MTPQDPDRLEAITSALARMVRRQAEIEQRLARLEAALKIEPSSPQVELPQPPILASPPPPRPAPLPPNPEPPSRRLETVFGLTWLGRIGMVTVVLALAFFFEYAFENHWITETGRVMLGLACGVTALLFGERLSRGGQRAFAQTLTAAGIAFLYLSVWASFALYHLIVHVAAFGLMLLVTAAAGALAFRYGAAAIAVLGLAGGYVTPLLLGSSRDPWFVLSYTVLLNLGAAIAARSRAWRWLEALALAGTVILYLSQWQSPVPQDMRSAYTAFLCLSYAQFALAPVRFVFLTAQLIAGWALVWVWIPPDVLGLALALAIAVAGLVVAGRRGWAAAVGGSFSGFWLAYGLWRGLHGYPFKLAGLPLFVLTAAFVAFLAWPVWLIRRCKQKLRRVDLVVLALTAAFYFGAGYNLLQLSYHGSQGLLAVAEALTFAGFSRLFWVEDTNASLLAAGIAWALIILAAPIQFAGYRVTLAWALEAAAVAWIGIRLRQPRSAYAAGLGFVLVLARLALVDSGMYSTPGSYLVLFNARFLAFLVSSFSLLAVAWWTRAHTRFAAVAYIGGHAVLLWGLTLEVIAWAERTAAPENIRSVSSASISVLIAAYAVVLVALGVFHRHAPTRLLGIALIGLIVLKLYLYDVWLLGQFYRMAAFAILGVLLLLMSYFYSRFRRSVETWWRP